MELGTKMEKKQKIEKVAEAFDKLDSKAKLVEEAMLLMPHKYTFDEQLKTLRGEHKGIEDLRIEMKRSLEQHEAVVKKIYKDNSEDIKRVQMKMFYLLEQLEKQPDGALFNQDSAAGIRSASSLTNGYLKPSNLNSNITNLVTESLPSDDSSFELSTPRLPTQYKKHPGLLSSVTRKNTFPIFQAMITEEDFASVPVYMKGRISLAEFQEFINNVFIRTFNFKYSILVKDRSKLKPSESTLRNHFMSQENYFEGMKFITAENIAQTMGKAMDKKNDRFIQMLRHLKVIREARKNSDVCYIWNRRI